jgi:predicted ABC-type ATPase
MDNQTTKQVYFQNGQYTEFRQMVHSSIVKDLMTNTVPGSESPLVIFLGGGVASGKTSISKLLLQTFEDQNESVVHVDSDTIKALLPEHRTFVQQDANTAAARLHEESGDIANMLYHHCLKEKVNVIVDGTMRDADNAERLIHMAREYGYKVSVVIADVPLDEALRRAEIRFKIEKRRVPEEFIRLSHEKVPLTIRRIENQVDSLYLYDTTERHPSQFYVKDQGEVNLVNEERLAQFFAKSELNPKSQEAWIVPDQPQLLKNVLKLGEGIPTGKQVTAELLNTLVKQYTFTTVNGIETLKYLRQGQNEIKQIRMERVPCLSNKTRDSWLDQASNGIRKPQINHTQGIEL